VYHETARINGVAMPISSRWHPTGAFESVLGFSSRMFRNSDSSMGHALCRSLRPLVNIRPIIECTE